GGVYVNEPGRGLPYLFAWVVCVFVSILLHEFGHILMGRLFGSHGYIVLYGFGGLAVGSSDLLRRWQRILVSLAGPLAQLLLFALLWAVGPPLVAGLEGKGAREFAEEILHQLVWINLGWAVLNLLPIWPLDGGKISRELLVALRPLEGVRVSLIVSLVT